MSDVLFTYIIIMLQYLLKSTITLDKRNVFFLSSVIEKR